MGSRGGRGCPSGGCGREVVAALGGTGRDCTGAREGVTSADVAEIKAMKAENRPLREDVAIWKAATSFFVGELNPHSG